MAESLVQTRLQLVRVQTMALTALVPVIGALVFLGEASNGGPVAGWSVLMDLGLLFLTGALFHVFGFTLNEWADVGVDSASRDLSGKPLVSGRVSRGEALGIAIGAAVASFVPLALLTTDPIPHGVLALAIVAGAAYDFKGKRLPLDLVLAGSLTALLLMGSLSTGSFDLSSTRHWTVFACLGGLQFLQNLFQNAVEGGIKDADHDAAAGTRTFAAVLGVQVSDGRVNSTGAFNASAIAMKAAYLTFLGYTALVVVPIPLGPEGAILAVIVLAMVSTMVLTLRRFLGDVPFDRSSLKRTFSVHEMATYSASVMVFVPLFGWTAGLVLLALPILWYMVANWALFSGALEPGV